MTLLSDTAPLSDVLEALRARLLDHARAIDVEPQTNSVKLLAHQLAGELQADPKAHDRLGKAVRSLAAAALADRSDRLRAYHSLDALDDRMAAFKDYFHTLGTSDFDAFRRAAEQHQMGIVFTAHPTFALPPELYTALAAKATGHDIAVDQQPHRPERAIDLKTEHQLVLSAIETARTVRAKFTKIVLDIAAERYPDRWTDLRPTLMSIATWVGYDLDGRSDIHWGTSLAFRLTEKAMQLRHYADSLQAIDPNNDSVHALRSAADLSEKQAALFAGDLDDPKVIVTASNALTRKADGRMTTLTPIIDALDKAVSQAADHDTDLAKRLALVRTEMQATGLGIAHIHLRVNAAQVRAALKEDLGVDEGVADFGRVAMARASERARKTKAAAISFASVFSEKMTARRQVMLSAQIAKHIDGDTPIRFLIAECERPATIVGAVYLATLYGAVDHIDISPLFETPEALERGGRFMEQLLDDPAYRDYIRRRGRLAIQIGYSDSGRFMGQIPAELAAERLQILLARALIKRGITDVEVIIFNTHGESMGRGAHPASFENRLDHLFTPWARQTYARGGLRALNEISFQGGDGYVHFANDTLATSTLLHVLSSGLMPPAPQDGDPFYGDINFTWDVYRALKAWQEALFANPDYGTALTAFAPQMLLPTGSRKAKRQASADAALRSLRAIPNNASLQQLGIPVNVCGGLGSTMAPEATQLAELFQGSKRSQALLSLALRARSVTSLPVFRAYADLYDASYWVARAAGEAKEASLEACIDIAESLANGDISGQLNRLGNTLGADLVHFDALIERSNLGPAAEDRHKDRLDLHILHAARLAIIMQVFVTAAQLPPFSRRHDLTRADILDLVLALRLRDAVDAIDQIFPEAAPAAELLMAIEEPSDMIDPSALGYPEIQAKIAAPIRAAIPVLEEISAAIAHHYGAWG